MHYLIIAQAGKKKKYAIKDSTVTVGSAPDNPVTLSDPSISKTHCRIERVPEGFRIVDLKSESGVFINGKKVANALVMENDVIQIGDVKMAIRELKSQAGGNKSTSPASQRAKAASQAAAKSPVQEDDGSTLNIKKEFREASQEKKNRLVRRKLRQGSRIPGWAQAVMVVWVVIAVVGIVLVVMKQAEPSPYQATFLKAKNLERDSKPEAAIAAFEQIPLSDSQFGKQAAHEADRLRREIELKDKQKKHNSAVSWFENNIKLFINKYIDAPEGDTGRAKAILRDYALHRKAYVRVLILNRLSYYLENFKGQRDYDEVTRFVEKYAMEYDPSAPIFYEDIQIEAETWMTIHNYGKAQQALLGWREKNKDKILPSELKRWEKTLNNVERLLISEWGMRDSYVQEMESKNNYKEANRIYHRFLKRCEGYDTPTANQFVEHWQKKFDENEIRIQEQTSFIKKQF